MDNYAREAAYEKLKDIITIADKDDFFIADEVIEAILRLDKEQAPLDITVGKGVYIDKSVRINKGVQIHRDAHITGNVLLNEGVVIQENVRLSTFHGQHLKIGPGTEIFQESEIKGNTEMGANCRIESHVNITGSNVHPTRIGDNVVIKGRTYVYGCIIENDVKIEHSVLKSKKVERRIRPDGSIQPIRYVIPTPEGLDSISPLKEA
jgi:bifunctional UDP-N-acetylglucosamine pyrophosphorylase/glucosamine-1-phosphate N-acetyltransferase